MYYIGSRNIHHSYTVYTIYSYTVYIIILHWFGLSSPLSQVSHPPATTHILATTYALHFEILSPVINIITVFTPLHPALAYFNILFSNLACGDLLNTRRRVRTNNEFNRFIERKI